MCAFKKSKKKQVYNYHQEKNGWKKKEGREREKKRVRAEGKKAKGESSMDGEKVMLVGVCVLGVLSQQSS